MREGKLKIAVVAPAARLEPESAERVQEIARTGYPGRVELVFHPQCFLASGHFAGDDETRTNAFVESANDESFSALWFARGGYGSGRIAEAVLSRLNAAARRKLYLGYSDGAFLLAGLYRHGFHAVHGPFRTTSDAPAARKR